nr:MAG TPA: hypothetical protein [Caudoviricetes sp.]
MLVAIRVRLIYRLIQVILISMLYKEQEIYHVNNF